MDTIASEGEAYPFATDNEAWSISWHRPPTPPDGTPHGSSGVCVTPEGSIILVSQNGIDWDLPGGRPEGAETWEATLQREMHEEACVRVLHARLLGFARAACTNGIDRGHVIVRAFYVATVAVDPWDPHFEITQRRFVSPTDALHATFWGYAPIYRRVLVEAKLL